MQLRFIKLIFTLLTTGTFPIIRKIFKGYTVMFSRIIDKAADGADVFAGCFML